MKNALLLIPAVMLLLVSCGGSENAKSDKARPIVKAKKSEKVVEKPAESVEKNTVEVTLGSNDQMKYDKAEIRVPANSSVKLTLVHNGTMPKEAMGHNFVLLKKGTDLAAFGMKAIEAGVAKEHIPSGNEVIAHTKLIGGGEQTTITFDAPAAGTYDFICSFPGHYAMMKGKFIVE